MFVPFIVKPIITDTPVNVYIFLDFAIFACGSDKTGRMEGWKSGRKKRIIFFHSSNLPLV
jgi:hypothetical protein